MRNWLAVTLAAILGLSSTGMAAAQDYPARPITMIVPFPAGGATDTLARFLAEKMRPILGQPIIIENVAGAAGSIGVGRAVRSPADGYTLSIGTSTTHMLTGGLYRAALRPAQGSRAGRRNRQRAALDRRQEDLPADDLKGLIAWLKANPDKASVGIAGVGADRASHRDLVPEGDRHEVSVRAVSRQRAGDAGSAGGTDRFHDRAGLELQVAGGFRQRQAVCHHRADRLPSSPDIPTADEAGLPGFFASLWYGLWVPKDTPKDIIAKLNATLVQVLADPAVKNGWTIWASRSRRWPAIAGSVAALQKAETERWWPIIKASNIKAE